MHMLSKKCLSSEELEDSAEIQDPQNGGNGQWASAD